MKEKQQAEDAELNEEFESADLHSNVETISNVNQGSHGKLHVEFKEPTIIESEKENIPTHTKVGF